MVDAPRRHVAAHHTTTRHTAHQDAPAAKPAAAAQPRAAAASTAQSRHLDRFEAHAASSKPHGAPKILHTIAHKLASAAKDRVKSALKDLPKDLAKMAHDRLTKKLEESVEKGVKNCVTPGQKANLLHQVKALQALNFGKFAHSLVHSLNAQQKALHDLHKKGGNPLKEQKAFHDATKGIADSFKNFADGAKKYSHMRQQVEAGCRPDPNANPLFNFQFHLPKPEILRIRPERPSPGIHLVPGGGLQLHFGLPGTSVAPKLNLIPVPRHTSPQLIA